MPGRKITNVIAGSLIALSLLPILLIFIVSNRLVDASLRRSSELSLAAIANAASAQTQRALQSADRILGSLELFLPSAPDSRVLDSFIDSTRASRTDITSFILSDTQGRILSLSPPDQRLRGNDYSGQPGFARALREDGTVFSEPYVSSLDGSMTVAAYRRMYQCVGIVLIDLDALGDYVSSLLISPADRIAIADSAGRFIAHTDRAAVQEQRYAELPPGFEGGPVALMIGGTEYLVHRDPIPGTDWSVIYYRDLLEALTLNREVARNIFLIAAVAAVIAVLAALAINRALTAPFADILSKISELSSGRYDRRISGEWPVELSTIGEAFNRMAENIETRDRELQKSEERYRALFFGSEVPALLVEPGSGAIRDANRAAAIYYGYDREELLARGVEDLAPAPSMDLVRDGAPYPSRGGGRAKLRQVLKSGEEREVELFGSPLEIEGKEYLYAIVFDVTERVEAEEQVQRDLREKVVLLKEIHHRVKNNLQIISSLLHLQERYVRDDADLELFRTSQNRVYSMALTHELLYQSDFLSSVDMREYAQKLLAYLRDLHPQSSFQLEEMIERVSLPLEQALPCGLIMTELVTNAFKYAMPPGVDARLSLRFGRAPASPGAGKDRIVLEVEDDGPGLPEGFEPLKSDSLGMSLILSLCRQLDGELSLRSAKPGESRPGLLAVVSFPLP